MTEINEAIKNIDLGEYLDHEGIKYRRAGGGSNFNLKECPFCGDTRWKVYVHAIKKTGLCFHGDCNARFNFFSFVRECHGYDNPATFRHIENYAQSIGFRIAPKEPVAVVTTGWELPESTPIPTADGRTHQSLLDRAILLDTQERYALRWCEEGYHDYTDDNGDQKRQRFSQRIIIPVHDLDGIVKTFVGRDGTGKADKRYLFPATLPGTGRYLYGAHLLTGKEDSLVICEGPFDVMATHQAIRDFPDFRQHGVVGSFGLSIGMSDIGENNDQLHRLFELRNRGVSKLTFMYDGEPGAFSAAAKNAMLLNNKGFSCRIAKLPQDKDPNEVPTEVVREAIQNAEPYSQMKYLQWINQSPYT